MMNQALRKLQGLPQLIKFVLMGGDLLIAFGLVELARLYGLVPERLVWWADGGAALLVIAAWLLVARLWR